MRSWSVFLWLHVIGNARFRYTFQLFKQAFAERLVRSIIHEMIISFSCIALPKPQSLKPWNWRPCPMMWRRRLLFWDHSAIAALEWWPRRLCTDWSWGYCNCRAGEDRRVIEDQRRFFTFAFDKFHMENCYLYNDSRILIIRKSKGRFSGAMQFFTKCPCVPARRVWMAWGEVVETQASLRLNLFRLGPSHSPHPYISISVQWEICHEYQEKFIWHHFTPMPHATCLYWVRKASFYQHFKKTTIQMIHLLLLSSFQLMEPPPLPAVIWPAPGIESLSHELDSVKYDMGELKDNPHGGGNTQVPRYD